jgi:hypothetical protein
MSHMPGGAAPSPLMNGSCSPTVLRYVASKVANAILGSSGKLMSRPDATTMRSAAEERNGSPEQNFVLNTRMLDEDDRGAAADL